MTLSPAALAKAQKAEIAARVEAALRNFEDAVGGRSALIDALQHAPQTDEIQWVIGILADPRNDADSLAAICRDAGITVGSLWQHFKDAHLARAQVQALAKVSERLSAVVTDLLDRAVGRDVVCDVCFGLEVGKDKKGKPKTCGKCGGKGFVQVEPDVKRQELALEIGGLLKRGGGVNVNVQQTMATFVVGDTMARVQRATDRILYGARERPAAVTETVEAEPVNET